MMVLEGWAIVAIEDENGNWIRYFEAVKLDPGMALIPASQAEKVWSE